MKAAVFAALGFAASLSALHLLAPPPAPASARAERQTLPLVFEPNQGQFAAEVAYLARGQQMRVGLSANAAHLQGHAGELRIALDGARADAPLRAESPTGGLSHYYPPSGTPRTHIPHYSAVAVDQAWPGVDVRWYGNEQRLEYDFIVAPGAKPEQIALDVQGEQALRLDAAGNLVITAANGAEFVQQAPVSYQMKNGLREPVGSRYVFDGEIIEIALADYDRSRELVIDPILTYGSFIGGDGTDDAVAVQVDATGTYIAGNGRGTNGSFSGQIGASDYSVGSSYVLKLNPAGNAVIYSTFYGGGNVQDMAVDASGAAYVLGVGNPGVVTTPGSFKETTDHFFDGWVAKFAADGSLSYGTFLGGSNDEEFFGIAVNGAGQVAVTGYSDGPNYPVVNAFQPAYQGCAGSSPASDAVLSVLNASGSALVMSTYLGGSGCERGSSVAFGPDGSLYVRGITDSNNFPSSPGAFRTSRQGGQDDFVAKFNPATGARIYSSYFGGNQNEGCTGGIAVNSVNEALFTGCTRSAQTDGFPIANPLGHPESSVPLDTLGAGVMGYVAQLNASGTGLLFSSYFGDPDGSSNVLEDIAIDASGNVHVSGMTAGGDGAFPCLGCVNRRPLFGALDQDLMVASMTPLTGLRPVLTLSSRISGRTVEGSGGARQTSVAADGSSSLYLVSGTALGSSSASDLPTLPGALRLNDDGSAEGVLYKFVTGNGTGGGSLSLVGASSTVPEGTGSGRDGILEVARIGDNAASAFAKYTVGGTASIAQNCGPGVDVAITLNDSQFGFDGILVSWPAGDNSPREITFRVCGDFSFESDEFFEFGLVAASVITSGANQIHRVTLVDDDTTAEFALSTDFTVNEGVGTATAFVERSGDPALAASVQFSFVDGTAANASDYNGTAGTLNWAAGDAAPKAITIPIVDDSLTESAETFVVQLSNPSAGTTINGARPSATITITDNDLNGRFVFDPVTYTVAENGVMATLTVRRLGGTAGAVTVNFASSDGSATAGLDYTATSGTLSFAEGETSKTFSLMVINDNEIEPNETVNFALSNPTGGATLAAGMADTAVLTITNDDAAGSFQLAADSTNPSVVEGQTATLTIERVNGSSGAASVIFRTTGGTATAGSDFTAQTGTVVNFAAGQTSRTVSLFTTDDTEVESSETVTYQLESPSAGSNLLAGPRAGTLTITDNDIAPTVQFSAVSFSGSELSNTGAITVTRTGNSTAAASVTLTASNGTAIQPEDYNALSVPVNFASGETSRTVNLGIVNDTIVEPLETVNLTLSAPTGATLGAPSTAVLNISDDDVGGSIQFSSESFSVIEANVNAVITVTRSGGNASGVSVSFASSNGSATAGADYTSTLTTVTFGAGESSRTVNVPILDDSLVEGAETVNLTLTNATGGATLGTPNPATLTITDNDSGGTTTGGTTTGGGSTGGTTTGGGTAGGGAGSGATTPVTLEGTDGKGGGALGGWLLIPMLLAGLRRSRRLLAAALLLPLAAQAQEAKPPYAIGVRGGITQSGISDLRLSTALNARGHSVTVREDETSRGLAVYVSGPWLRNFSWELEGSYQGEYRISVSGNVTNLDQFVRDVQEESTLGAGHGLALRGRWHLPIAGGFSFSPSVGMHYWTRDLELLLNGTRRTVSDDDFGSVVGLELRYAFGRHWGLGLGTDVYVPDSHNAITHYNLGLQYAF